MGSTNYGGKKCYDSFGTCADFLNELNDQFLFPTPDDLLQMNEGIFFAKIDVVLILTDNSFAPDYAIIPNSECNLFICSHIVLPALDSTISGILG